MCDESCGDGDASRSSARDTRRVGRQSQIYVKIQVGIFQILSCWGGQAPRDALGRRAGRRVKSAVPKDTFRTLGFDPERESRGCPVLRSRTPQRSTLFQIEFSIPCVQREAKTRALSTRISVSFSFVSPTRGGATRALRRTRSSTVLARHALTHRFPKVGTATGFVSRKSGPRTGSSLREAPNRSSRHARADSEWRMLVAFWSGVSGGFAHREGWNE